MFVIQKKFTIEMAHQLSCAFTKECHETIHGHSYEIVLHVAADDVGPDGMVADFGWIKIEAASEFAREWDHCLMIHEQGESHFQSYYAALKKQNVRLVLVPWNPTAENMAREIFVRMTNRWRGVSGIRLVQVDVRETATGMASYRP